MVDRIVRDVDVMANDQTIDDPANFASTGVAINSEAIRKVSSRKLGFTRRSDS